MVERRVFLILAVILMVVCPSAIDQTKAGGIWSTWLMSFDGQTDVSPQEPMLIRIFEDGTSEQHILPIPKGAFLQFPRFAFTDNGDWIAYCTTTPDPFHVDLHVVDLYVSQDVMTGASGVTLPITYPLDSAINCLSMAFINTAFTPQGDMTLAVSVQNDIRGNEPPGQAPPQWEILILNLTTGAIEQRLTSDMPVTTSIVTYNANPDGLMPEIRWYDNSVAFVITPQHGCPLASEFQAYLWDADAGTVIAYAQHGHQFVDRMQLLDETGQTVRTEIVWAELNSSFANREVVDPCGTHPLFNTIMMDNGAGAVYPVLIESEGLWNPKFIDQGRHLVAITSSHGAIALNRNGELIELPVDQNSAWRMVDAPDGYAFLEMTADEGSTITRLVHHNFVLDPENRSAVGTRILWENRDHQGWTIVWSSPTPTVAEIPFFPDATP